MPPYPSKHQSDDDTVDSSNSDDDQPSPLMPTATTNNSKSSSFAAKKRNRLTTISRKYDLDGDGELDEAEQAMRDRDVANRGFLTNDEIYAIVQEQLKAKRSAGYMKRLIAGLICFVVLLAMSNLGTSLAAAFLAKDLKADEGGSSSSSSTQENGDSENVPAMRVSSTGEIASAQTVADTYSASEMTDDELLERRRLVLQEMDDDPHSHSHRRDLRACMASRSRDTNGCNNKITFDSRTIPEEEFDIIESKCGRQQNVYIQRKWGGKNGENQKDTRSDCICSRGSSVVVKEKNGNNKKKNNNKNNDKKNNGKKNKKEKGKKKKKEPRNREVIIENNGRKLHVDCIDGKCYCGGTTLQGELHDRCVLGADECGPRLVCERDSNNKKNKNVRVSTSSRYGTCRKPTKVSSVVMKRQGGGGYCSISDGWDACDKGHYCAVDFDEYDYDFEVSTRTVKRGGYGGGNNYGDCTNDRDSCAQGYACVTPNGGDQWHCRADESWGDTMSVSAGRRSGGGGASVSGVGTCVRTVGHGQTCYSDYACGSNYVCDYGSANNRNSQAGVSYGGDCSYTGQCANGAKCVQSSLNGSDRANCEYDDAYWYESSVVTRGGVCAKGSVVYRSAGTAVVNNRPSVSTCQVWGNDCTNCRSGCPGGSSCYKSPLNGSDRWNCA